MSQISIVMPVHDGQEWLPACLDDVLAQTMGDFELIVVDDASRDETPAILGDYARRDRRLRVVTHEVNMHAGVARNDGMDVATGEHLLFLDADDRLEPTLLGRVLATARSADADVVLFGADDFGDDLAFARPNQFYLDVALVPGRQPFSRDDVPGRLFQICTPEPWTKLFRRSFVEREGLRFQGMQNANDLFFTLFALAKAERVAVCPDVLVHHRVGTSGGIQSSRSREPLAFLEALRALRAGLDREGLLPELAASFANLAVFHCLYNSDAPADWPAVFEELGVARLSAADFYVPGDFERCVGLALADAEEGPRHRSSGFWEDVAIREWGHARAAAAELARVRSSTAFKLGEALTSPLRGLQGLLGNRRT